MISQLVVTICQVLNTATPDVTAQEVMESTAEGHEAREDYETSTPPAKKQMKVTFNPLKKEEQCKKQLRTL
jgi:hypothetical protein